MGKVANISGAELDGSYQLRQSKVDNLSISTHDGTELQPMIVASLKQTGANGLANQIEALDVQPQAGYDSTARRRWSIANARRGTFVAKVSIRLATGEDKVSADFEQDTFTDVQSAVAWVIGELGGTVFKAQIEAL